MATFNAKDFKSDLKPIWCPGCGDFGVLAAAYRAFAELDLDPDRTVVVVRHRLLEPLPGLRDDLRLPRRSRPRAAHRDGREDGQPRT